MRKQSIVIHHSLTPDGAAADWQSIRRYHTSWKLDGRAISAAEATEAAKAGKKPEGPWLDVGYHFGVEKVGDRVEAFVGRPLDRDGAHTTQGGMNSTGVGVLMVGNFDLAAPDPALLAYTVNHVVGPIMIALGIPVEKVYPHSRWATYKSCPGLKFPWSEFIELVRKRVAE